MNNYPEYVQIGKKRYKINTDFRVAIECNRVARDESIGNIERALGVIYMLFGDDGLNDRNNYNALLELAKKYLACGKELEDTNEEPNMDYVKDMDYIEASFMSDYHIDLPNQKMHWWKFFNLICGLSNSELGNCCVLNRIRNLRDFDVSQISDEKERNKIIKMKNQVSLNKKQKEIHLTEEQQKSADEFYEALGF